MLLLRYLLMFTGIGLLAWSGRNPRLGPVSNFEITKGSRDGGSGEASTYSPELPQPAPVFHWQGAKRLATWGVIPLLTGLSIAMVPSGRRESGSTNFCRNLAPRRFIRAFISSCL